MNIRDVITYSVSLFLSLSVHAALLSTAPAVKETKKKRTTVEMTIIEPPEPVEIEPPPPPPEPKPEPKPLPKAKPKPVPKEVRAEDLAPTPPPSTSEAALRAMRRRRCPLLA